MKIIEAINAIDALKHNTYTQHEKLQWLSRLDWMVKREIVDVHEGEEVTFEAYDDQTDPETELLVPAPYDEVYMRWMEAQIDYHNGEYGKYNNSITMFNEAYKAFSNYYTRTHMPKGKRLKFF